MATILSDRISYNDAYSDNSMGPVASVEALTGLTNLFQGLTVTVLAPVPMELWLRDGKTRAYWRIKRFKPFATFEDLQAKTSAIVAQMQGLFEKGVEATVLADETNNGEFTKYYLDSKTRVEGVWTLTWKKVSANAGVTVDGDDLQNE